MGRSGRRQLHSPITNNLSSFLFGNVWHWQASASRARWSTASDIPGLVVRLLCGIGMGRLAALRPRVRDVDRQCREIVGCEGSKDRVAVLPASPVQAMQNQFMRRRRVCGSDLTTGKADVQLPEALARKHPPSHHPYFVN